MLDVNVFDSMRIGLASPDKIRFWSHGEVKKPETINYRTLKPERDGLFCERIFGPTRDWECHCGKYKRIRYKGTICDRCGVEVTRAKVRRERMGHIELAAPVSHIWYFKGIPSRMGLLLDMSPRALERVLYFASYIVLESQTPELKPKDILTEGQYRLARETYGRDSFKVGMGAEAIQKLLSFLDLDEMAGQLREELISSNGQKRVRAIRRLEVVEAFRKSGNKPEWMILTVIPVIPPELRPMVQLDGGRFATSDLNDLYRRVINRNNRLRRLLNLKAPDIIVRNEKRMLQEAVDALIDNGRRGRPVTGPGNRPLKSLSDMLKGKQGRFRQNLLGKRVDYSGRSVIVVGPKLKLHQCGLPKEMALELFKPFVMKKLSADSNLTIKAAKRKVDRANAEVWGVLEEVIKEHPVLLNRAPTLHRLGIQAFEPVLTEGRALKLHPLACTAYNADFDGDQMAIHLPLSAEAQAEARVLMLAANHILAPKDGKPIIVPTQDMVLGTYYLTKIRDKGEGKNFPLKAYSSYNEALLAYDSGDLSLQTEILVRLEYEGELQLVRTSVGRMIFNEILPSELRQFKRDAEGKLTLGTVMSKKELGKLVAECFNKFGATKTAEVIDGVKRLGYHYACIAGMTVAISDVIVPPAKKDIIAETSSKVKRVEMFFNRGLLTDQERYNKVIALWEEATNRVADAMMSNMDPFNPIFMMADSGARGNKQQMRQLAGMRGLMADPSGKTIDLPITANFREGLSVSDYFISSHGARKGLADTALRTADSGYLTRRLVDVAQDVIVRQKDCDIRSINLTLIRARLANDTFDALELLSEALLGRVVGADVIDPKTGEVAIATDSILDDAALELLGELNTPEISLRGQSLTAPNAASHSLVSEVIKLGTRDETERKRLREAFLRELIGKNLAQMVFDYEPETPIERDLAEAILDAEEISELQIRMGNIRGIDVEAIVEETRGSQTEEIDAHDALKYIGRTLAKDFAALNLPAGTKLTTGIAKKIAALQTDGIIGRTLAEDIYDDDGNLSAKVDDIIGRTLAEDIYDGGGNLIAKVDDRIDESNLPKICEVRDKVSIRSVAELQTDRIIGRTLAEDIYDNDGNLIAKVDEIIDESKLQKICEVRDKVLIRSVAELNLPAFTAQTLHLKAQKGVIEPLADRIIGRTLAEDIYDDDGCLIAKVNDMIDESNVQKICEVRDKVSIRSVLTCKSPFGVCQKCYGRDLANQTEVEVGEAVGIIAAQSIGEPGTQLTMRTFHTGGVAGGDITQGLPRVEELFEARKPKNNAIIAEIDGIVSFGTDEKTGLKTVIITPHDLNNQQSREYVIPFGIQPKVKPDDEIHAGDNITDGAKNPHDILRICGLKETHRYLVKEVQKVYKSQGVEINDKHIEVMVRQMLHKVKIEDSGSTEFLPGEYVDVNIFEAENTKAIEEDRAPAVAKPILLGITKASLATDSFLSAASFQETTRVLTDAAIKGKIDPLIGLKENVIIGKLIPAGTGMSHYRDLKVIDNEAVDEENSAAE
ncbi:MAG: DNA-directed RNA polymerase subunit beta' [Selenomonadaceae bacterium]|nr:DNA-directed RNA polymerase subunit beta' [Selenomonadaceae bacterium]